ncbi:MAG: M15 family metallopeptidase [Rikenellaceae bacterium]
MRFIAIIFTLFSYFSVTAQTINNNTNNTTSHKNITEIDIQNSFTSCEISDEIFARIKGLSYNDACTTPLSSLRYITVLHYNGNGEICTGEMICHHSISDDLLEIFRTLFDAHYPIEKMELIDNFNAQDDLSMLANNSSAFNFRYISGTKKLSSHSLGLAIDINPLYNPYVKQTSTKTIVSPSESINYVDRSRTFPYKIDHDDLCYKEFIKHGFIWGGDWSSVKDYQHFEKKL